MTNALGDVGPRSGRQDEAGGQTATRLPARDGSDAPDLLVSRHWASFEWGVAKKRNSAWGATLGAAMRLWQFLQIVIAGLLGMGSLAVGQPAPGSFTIAMLGALGAGDGEAPAASQIAEFALSRQIALFDPFREDAEAGALMSVGVSSDDPWRLGAGYVDKILDGEKPADLPARLPIKYEVVINLKTAKAIGVTIPQAILAAADRVIE
jgi:hypothetical protein